MSKSVKTALPETAYAILKKPLVTEKSTRLAEAGSWVAFEVQPTATKPQIKQAVEGLYKVKVERVNTARIHGKQKSFKGHATQRATRKKAYIKLAAGQTIDFSTGV